MTAAHNRTEKSAGVGLNETCLAQLVSNKLDTILFGPARRTCHILVHVANFSYCPGSKREAALNVLKFVLFPGRISLGVRNPKLTLLDYRNTRLPGGSG